MPTWKRISCGGPERSGRWIMHDRPALNKETVLHTIVVPAVMPFLFFAVALSPVDLLGCRTRGLIAFSLAFVSGLAAMGTAVVAMKGRLKGMLVLSGGLMRR